MAADNPAKRTVEITVILFMGNAGLTTKAQRQRVSRSDNRVRCSHLFDDVPIKPFHLIAAF